MIDVGQFRRNESFDVQYVPVRCLPGRLCVLMDEVVQGSILVNREACTGVVIASGCDEYPNGTRVIVWHEHGLQMDYRDAGWIPKGADVRFYGVSCPTSESVVAVLN